MLEFLSTEWIKALGEAAAGQPGIGGGVDLTVQQTVEAPTGSVTYHVHFGGDGVTVAAGPAAGAAIQFRSDAATARALAAGSLSAQRAFMAGDLRVGGDLRLLLEHQEALSRIGDLFGAVRSRTLLASEAVGSDGQGPDA